MISRAERKRRKAIVSEALLMAYFTLKKVDGLLDFNKQLKTKFSDIWSRLLFLHDKLEEKK